jgi:2-keto-3-deoxy-L-rhamnonate aldolase RhmA
VSANDPAEIGRIADAGAELIVVPMIQSVEDADRAVRAVRYPPAGGRSFGPFGVAADSQRPDDIESHVGVLAMVETAAALRDLDAICAVPGLFGVYIGPADLSLALGMEPMRAFDTDQLDDVLDQILRVTAPHGLLTGIHSRSGERAAWYGRLGFDFVTIGNELALLGAAVGQELTRARSDDEGGRNEDSY